MYYVYILRCSGDRLYTGVTTDVARRVAEHAHSPRGAKFTRAFAPETLAAVWETDSRADALRLENRIKKLTHAQKDRLIRLNDCSVIGSLPETVRYRRIS